MWLANVADECIQWSHRKGTKRKSTQCFYSLDRIVFFPSPEPDLLLLLLLPSMPSSPPHPPQLARIARQACHGAPGTHGAGCGIVGDACDLASRFCSIPLPLAHSRPPSAPEAVQARGRTRDLNV